ncbi:integrase catalytic domain-containing protein [Trichonephila clavipes]|nr:integrase catalytic domain-containing protein [Trichonephila clavipes]
MDRESQRLFQLNLKTTEVPSLQDFCSFLETGCIQLESIRKTDYGTKIILCTTCRSNNVNSKHNILVCETKISFPMEKIVSTLGNEKVLQPSSEELTVEPSPRSVALAFKEKIPEGSELANKVANDTKMVAKLTTNLVAKNDANLALPPRFRQVLFQSPLLHLVIPQGIVLADEGFNQPSEISCLIGSEHFFDIFETKQIRVPNNNFRLSDSKFGYVVTGSYIDEPCYFKHCFLSKVCNTLRSFWETENHFEEQPIISDELSYCEKHFEETHFRKPCGRYSVSLPFKENVNLGDSRSIASKRLDQLWRRLDRDPKLNNLYTKFIEEYLSLDHMEEITNIDDIASEKSLNKPVQIFKLKTVTYGTTPACYLSTRVLKQLSLDERENFPKAADIVLHDVYLDDILSGCSSLNELDLLKTELSQLFKSAGMSLPKWCFSHSTNNFPDLHFDQSCEEGIPKTLGVLWNSSSDTFCFKVSPSTNHIFTKRDVLSQIARIFDPLGLLGPVISKAKFFMQQLWLLKLEWHEKLPVPIAAEWVSFVQSLPVLERLKIPRFVLSENLESMILYGFSDASEKGVGAVIYVSVIKNNGDRHSQLLCSKSRVAPLKTLIIPRLELSACLLLSKLIRKILLNARSSKNKRVSGPLSLKEVNQAELWLIKLVQKAEFSNEIKSLLRVEPVHRSTGSSNLTLQEFIILAEIEAVLNSRPLSPLSSDFDDFKTLSPGHFLIGRPVTAIVEPQLINVKEIDYPDGK